MPILKNLDVYERTKIADALKEKRVAKGETIIKMGDIDDSYFYIMLEGKAVATLDSDEVVKDYTNGDYFGELALLRQEPRAANIIATEDCKLIYLDMNSFGRLLGPL